MSAVWRVARGALRRRRLVTTAIALVVLCSAITIQLALTLLLASSGPFDQAFDGQRGAHVVASFADLPSARLAATRTKPGVQAAAGPFDEAEIQIPPNWLGLAGGPLTVVGRADPGGPVDDVALLSGHWATGTGQLVLNWSFGRPPSADLGTTLRLPGLPTLTVVGFANSMSGSAGGWVTPGTIGRLHPAGRQLLYRFTEAATTDQIRAGLAAITEGLPPGALVSAQSYLTLKQAFSAQANAFVPFLAVFGVLGLVVAVLIVANVVSGAVVSGSRHIGVLKSLGYTPNQVLAVYLTMIALPAIAGAVVGTGLGALGARPLLTLAFAGADTGTAPLSPDPLASIAPLVGLPVLALLTAFLPALRAHRLSAARAISAGSAPATGRGLRVQRWLSGSRLPRSVSLGLGLPFARPGRTVLMVAALVLGAMAVTITVGVSATMSATQNGDRVAQSAIVQVQTDNPRHTDAEIEAMLRDRPGVTAFTARWLTQVNVLGYARQVFGDFYRGELSIVQPPLAEGRWPTGPGQVVAGPTFLAQHGLTVGDPITLAANGHELRATVVGELTGGNAQALVSDWPSLTRLVPNPTPSEYDVRLAPGTDAQRFIDAVHTADPGLTASVNTPGNAATVTVTGFASVFTALLAIVAALGVFNTVLLTVRERRRDLGMLKSIGMTPRQVTGLAVASVLGPGLIGGILGIPLGMIAHRLIVDHVGLIAFPDAAKDIWQPLPLIALALSGVLIAVLGALVPARSAAQLPIATVLHNE